MIISEKLSKLQTDLFINIRNEHFKFLHLKMNINYHFEISTKAIFLSYFATENSSISRRSSNISWKCLVNKSFATANFEVLYNSKGKGYVFYFIELRILYRRILLSNSSIICGYWTKLLFNNCLYFSHYWTISLKLAYPNIYWYRSLIISTGSSKERQLKRFARRVSLYIGIISLCL